MSFDKLFYLTAEVHFNFYNIISCLILYQVVPTLHAGFLVSVHRISIMENRPVVVVDPGNIHGSHRPISFMRIKYITLANDLP